MGVPHFHKNSWTLVQHKIAAMNMIVSCIPNFQNDLGNLLYPMRKVWSKAHFSEERIL
jgi:hypothetical protein